MILAFEILFVSYFILVIVLISAGKRAVNTMLITPAVQKEELYISVIIPVRNEKNTIEFLIQDLKSQQYNTFEVLIVDDHSEDDTFESVIAHAGFDERFNILQNAGSGKKKALTTGIEAAQGTIIVTTDADCRVGEKWLDVINRYFQNDTMQLGFGGVKIKGPDSLFTTLQVMEFSSLIGAGIASWAMGFPSMCNGANLAFRKSVFDEVGGYTGNFHVPSGDDEFLLRSVAEKYPKGICFLNDSQSVVSTLPQSSFKAFLYQRIRWAGKWRFHKTVSSKLLALYVFVFQLSWVLFIGGGIAGYFTVDVVLLLVFLKMTVEYFYLRNIAAFLQIGWSWVSFILLQALYPFYVFCIGFVSNFKSFEWKGRKLKSIRLKPAND